MKIFRLFILFTLLYNTAAAQQDSIKIADHAFETSMFANDDTLTRNDYLLGIAKMYQTLNKSSALTQSIPAVEAMNTDMDEDDSALNIIKDRLSPSERIPNIRTVQMFSTLLDQLHEDTKDYRKKLTLFDSDLDGTRAEIFQLRKDTVVRKIFRSRLLMTSFDDQLSQLRIKWKTADSLIKKVNRSIDNTLARSSGNLIEIEELQNRVQLLLKATGIKAFGKEGRYIWEPHKIITESLSMSNNFKKSIEDEKKITEYYFTHTHNQIYLLLVIGLIFFYWIFYNFKSLKNINKLEGLEVLKLHYINPRPVFATLIFMFNLAPIFDLNAPEIYIESIVVLLMIILTLHFRKNLLRHLFYWWIVFVLIFLSLLFRRLTGLPFNLQRWWMLVFNGTSFILASFVMLKFRKYFGEHKIIFLTGGVYILFNLFAFICNLYGRITLTSIFSSTAIYAFIQMISLVIFVQIVKEAFLLQIQSSRLRKNYLASFDYNNISKGITRLVTLLTVIIWLMVFATNLNIYSAVTTQLNDVFTATRKLGNFSFSYRGIILFLLIIWIANFLQKYIAYFFGDTGDDATIDNKGQRSRLLITRLILLIAGFLLAIAASGLPVDKITVILGALGVGIGLGLQSIVNNFVSGIILIFDKTLRVGDTVEIGDKKGRVKEISVRSSTLLTPEGAEVIIPNGDILSHNIVNWTLSNNYIRADVAFTIDELIFHEDVRADIAGIIQSLPESLTQKEPEIVINNVTSQSTQLKVFFWVKDINKIESARSDAYSAIYKYLEGKGIKILS